MDSCPLTVCGDKGGCPVLVGEGLVVDGLEQEVTAGNLLRDSQPGLGSYSQDFGGGGTV